LFRVLLCVGVPLILQFSIALFTGMVAATFAPPVRRAIPRSVEVSMYVALIVSCLLGVMSVKEPHARELTATLVWGVDQILNTVAGLLGAGILAWLHAWLYNHRFAIADGMILLLGADVLALMLIGSWRSGRAWQPRVRLREWMELPSPAVEPQTAPSDALDDVNRRWAAAVARAGAAALTSQARFSTWAREVMIPREAQRLARAAAAGGVESRERLDSLRDTAAHVQFAARSWYTAAGAPALDSLTARTVEALEHAAAARRGRRLAAFGPDHVVDIQALLNAQSTGWYSPMLPALPAPAPEDEDGSEHSDRLAS
jgi:hypothetical protein